MTARASKRVNVSTSKSKTMRASGNADVFNRNRRDHQIEWQSVETQFD